MHILGLKVTNSFAPSLFLFLRLRYTSKEFCLYMFSSVVTFVWSKLSPTRLPLPLSNYELWGPQPSTDFPLHRSSERAQTFLWLPGDWPMPEHVEPAYRSRPAVATHEEHACRYELSGRHLVSKRRRRKKKPIFMDLLNLMN